MKSFIISENESGQTLEKYLKAVLKNAPLSFIYHLFRKKDVKVNGHWQKEKYYLQAQDQVSIYVTDEQYFDFVKDDNEYRPNDYIKDWIIYEDDNVYIINKPKGVLVQKDASNKKALDQMVREYALFKGEYNPETDKAFTPSPCHRLDCNTSGLVVFGKNKITLQTLQEVFKNHEQVEKHYLALVKGDISKAGRIDLPLTKNEKTKMVYVDDNGKESITLYEPIKRFGECTLLDVSLLTGRTHQIRVHLASINHPIIGDNKYGDFALNSTYKKEFGLKTQFLHSYSLKFDKLKVPLNNLNNKLFKAPLPMDEEKIIRGMEHDEH